MSASTFKDLSLVSQTVAVIQGTVTVSVLDLFDAAFASAYCLEASWGVFGSGVFGSRS